MSISIVPNTQDTDVLSCKLIFASCPDKCDKSRKNLSLKNVLCSCFATSDTLILTKAKKKICNIWIWMKIEKNIVFTKYPMGNIPHAVLRMSDVISIEVPDLNTKNS
jgi:hypothetical protein